MVNDMEDKVQEYVQDYFTRVKRSIDEMGNPEYMEKIDKIVKILLNARENKKQIFVMGNGGSGSTASHLMCDLGKMTICENSPRFKVIALTDNIPLMLAWANDSSYDDIFVEQLKNLMNPGDIVFGISGSGNSPNVIKAIEYANEHEGITVGWTGFDGGKLAIAAQIAIVAPSHNMQRIEDIHMVLTHLVSSIIRDSLELPHECQ
jgi:D-sedoheptulose 7-phosphate isomerase